MSDHKLYYIVEFKNFGQWTRLLREEFDTPREAHERRLAYDSLFPATRVVEIERRRRVIDRMIRYTEPRKRRPRPEGGWTKPNSPTE